MVVQTGSLLIIVAAAAVATCCHGFSRVEPPRWRMSQKQQYASSLRLSTSSTHQLEVEQDSATTTATTLQRTALSMTLEELSETLGGMGRSQLTWDCLKLGVDPHYLFSQDYDSEEYADKDTLKKQVLPTPRQSQPLGSSALEKLSVLHSHCGNRIENGLATLVHISPSSDGTTKLLCE